MKATDLRFEVLRTAIPQIYFADFFNIYIYEMVVLYGTKFWKTSIQSLQTCDAIRGFNIDLTF